MELYWINLLLVLFWGILQELNGNLRAKRAISACMVAQLLLFSVLRHETVGSDTIQYINMFEHIANSNINLWELTFGDIEPGYVLLNYLIGLIDLDSRFFIIVMGVLILFPFVLLIERYSTKPWLSYYLFICLGFYNNSMFIYRQFMAIAVLVLALDFILRRKMVCFVLSVLLAVCFHRTAIIFLPLYWIYSLKINRGYLFKALLVGGLIFVLGPELIRIANNYARIQYEIGYSGGRTYLFMLLFLVWVLFMRLKEYLSDSRLKLFFHMLVLATLFQVLSLQMELFIRVVYYFVYSLIVLVPYAISACKSEFRPPVVVAACLFFAILYWANLQGEWTVAYKFMWE